MMIRYETIGNALNAFALVSVLAFTAAAVFYATPGSTFFDEEWVRHGFCVSNPEVPYWNSHDLCLYGDTMLVAIGLINFWDIFQRNTRQTDVCPSTHPPIA